MATDTVRMTRAAGALVLMLGLVVRLHGLTRPPMDFHPTRQYHGALVARGLYYRTVAHIPQVLRDNAEALVHGEDRLEPPVMECIAVAGYHLTHGEHLWFPRLVAALSWLSGGLALVALTRGLLGPEATLTALAFYLFSPYALVASRSFQPDPLMIALVLASLVALLRYHAAPTPRRLLAFTALAGAAFFVKPMALFFLLAPLVALASTRGPAWRTWPSLRVLVLAAVPFIPAAGYYTDGLFISGFLHHPAEGRFVPWMFATSAFWSAWWDRIRAVTGAVPFVLALAGSAFCTRGTARRLLAGALGGYLALGLVFSYHIHTHDYYSLPLVPFVAIGLGAFTARAVSLAQRPAARVALRLALAALLALGTAAGTRAAWARIDSAPGPWMAVRDQDIGARLGYASRVVLQDQNYGLPMDYNAHLVATYWPTAIDRREDGHQTDAATLLDAINRTTSHDFFIVADLRELTTQPDLRALLATRYPVYDQGRGYVIYDLRPRTASPPPP